MKIGLVLTGFSRFYKHTFPFFSNFINENNVDVYISTWDVVQSRPSNWNSNSNSYNFHVVKADKDEIIRLYSDTKKLINYNFENWSEYYSNRFDKIQILDRENDIFKTNHSAAKRGSFWIERLRDQWYIVKKGWDLIENPEKYDIIVKCRFDILFEKIELKNKDFVIIPSDIPNYNYCDYFAYGNYNSMKKYFNLFDHIETLYNNFNLDITHAENMLKFYMENYDGGIDTFVDSIKYKRIK